jgi:hypothetical protein
MVLLYGGTVYQKQDGPLTPAVGAVVHFRDSVGHDYRALTNCAGNFYVADGDYQPTYPVFVKTEFAVEIPMPPGPSLTVPLVQNMTSAIYETDGSTVSGLRDRSCAYCHGDPPGAQAAGHIYLAPAGGTPVPFPPVSCP